MIHLKNYSKILIIPIRVCFIPATARPTQAIKPCRSPNFSPPQKVYKICFITRLDQQIVLDTLKRFVAFVTKASTLTSLQIPVYSVTGRDTVE